MGAGGSVVVKGGPARARAADARERADVPDEAVVAVAIRRPERRRTRPAAKDAGPEEAAVVPAPPAVVSAVAVVRRVAEAKGLEVPADCAAAAIAAVTDYRRLSAASDSGST